MSKELTDHELMRLSEELTAISVMSREFSKNITRMKGELKLINKSISNIKKIIPKPKY